jgi:hypothetical protein
MSSKKKVFESPEELEMRSRWPLVLDQIKALVEHIQHIRISSNPQALPEELAQVAKKSIVDGLFNSIAEQTPPEVNRSTVRRMANKIGSYLLWRRESSVPAVHELIALAPWWISNMPGDVFRQLRDIGLEYVLNGRVLSIQTVWDDLLSAPVVFMGHCVCRSSKIADDLYDDQGQIYTTISEKQKKKLLDRMLDRYNALMQEHGELPDTDPKYAELLGRLDLARREKSDEYRLETLLESTHHSWEFIPVLEKYTPNWLRSMHSNRKAALLNRELAFELANIFFLSRAVIFSAMKFFDTPYCICSCPTPENGGGCVLTNWYYGGGSDTSLMSNEEHYGRRTDKDGNVLPCNLFPIRATRECIGCGCRHELRYPRSINTVLKQADQVFAEYRKQNDTI